MHVMHYEIGLPADYDMGVIEHRVATRGSATDDFPHLGLKAYAVRRIGRYGSRVNAYAPFYLWQDPAGLDAFLYGPFRAIVADFGRPPVRHWTGLAFRAGPGYDGTPTAATRRSEALSADHPLARLVEEAVGRAEATVATPGVHSAAVAVDPATWQLVELVLWTTPPPQVPGDAYQVLHVSAARLADLPQGRAW